MYVLVTLSKRIAMWSMTTFTHNISAWSFNNWKLFNLWTGLQENPADLVCQIWLWTTFWSRRSFIQPSWVKLQSRILQNWRLFALQTGLQNKNCRFGLAIPALDKFFMEKKLNLLLGFIALSAWISNDWKYFDLQTGRADSSAKSLQCESAESCAHHTSSMIVLWNRLVALLLLR